MHKITAQYRRPKKLIQELTEVWLCSVKSTHHFLTEQDIKKLYPLVSEALENVPFLLTAQNKENEYAGFMGIEGNKLEMLFIHPKAQKQGLGREFVNHALNAYRIGFVDVNEQNPDAYAFYRKMGFVCFGRSERDGLGNDFPLLHLKYARNHEEQ